MCVHTQLEVFFQIKLDSEMIFYSFYPGMKFASKRIFSSLDEISSWLHVNALLMWLF